MKKYLIYASVFLVVVFASLFIMKVYKNKYANYLETQSKVEELQKKVSELENNNIEQAKVTEELKSEIAQIKEDQTNKLQASIDSTNKLKSRLSAAEKNAANLQNSVDNSAATAYFISKW